MRFLHQVRRPRIALFGMTIVALLISDSTALARITFENKTKEPIIIYLQGQDQQRQGPIEVPPGFQRPYDAPPGLYRVFAKRQGKWEDMGWRNYSDNKITYSVASCSQCMPGGATIEISRTEVFHADGMYLCPKCGQMHVSWKTGLQPEGEHVAARPDFNPVGTFRLGVSVTDGDGGALVTNTVDGSPAIRMHRVDVEDGIDYRITPGINVVTHVNGKRVQNAEEFAQAIADSGRNLDLRIYNTERQTTRDYSTELN